MLRRRNIKHSSSLSVLRLSPTKPAGAAAGLHPEAHCTGSGAPGDSAAYLLVHGVGSGSDGGLVDLLKSCLNYARRKWLAFRAADRTPFPGQCPTARCRDLRKIGVHDLEPCGSTNQRTT